MKFTIGCDEALKGDTFGGIVCAGFFAGEELELKLANLKVNDSKKLTDNRINALTETFEEYFKDNFFIVDISAEKYNELIKTESMTQILVHAYVQIISKLVDRIKTTKTIMDDKELTIVVDEFPGSQALKKFFSNIVLTTQAESKFLEVAAASILARAYALKQIDALSKKAKYKLPLGSTHVSEALVFLRKGDFDLSKYAKQNFKNVKELAK